MLLFLGLLGVLTALENGGDQWKPALLPFVRMQRVYIERWRDLGLKGTLKEYGGVPSGNVLPEEKVKAIRDMYSVVSADQVEILELLHWMHIRELGPEGGFD